MKHISVEMRVITSFRKIITENLTFVERNRFFSPNYYWNYSLFQIFLYRASMSELEKRDKEAAHAEGEAN